MGSNPVINKNLVFKWRRVEGRAHYPPSYEPCPTGLRGFLGHWKKNRSTNSLKGEYISRFCLNIIKSRDLLNFDGVKSFINDGILYHKVEECTRYYGSLQKKKKPIHLYP